MPAILRVQRRVVLPIVLAAVVVSLFGFTPQADAASSRTTRAHAAANIAQNQQGDSYAYGGDGPNSFDCSGLVYYSYRAAGFSNIPRTSTAQARATRRISPSSMQRGDLVFFTSGGRVYHVGVYVGRQHGRRMIVHASRPGTPVKRDPIWTGSWFAGTMR